MKTASVSVTITETFTMDFVLIPALMAPIMTPPSETVPLAKQNAPPVPMPQLVPPVKQATLSLQEHVFQVKILKLMR
jgi:hypothetical protein